jgi:hypothetical protein
MITLRHYNRSHPIIAVAMIHHKLQQVEINLEYEKVLNWTYRHKPEIT